MKNLWNEKFVSKSTEFTRNYIINLELWSISFSLVQIEYEFLLYGRLNGPKTNLCDACASINAIMHSGSFSCHPYCVRLGNVQGTSCEWSIKSFPIYIPSFKSIDEWWANVIKLEPISHCLFCCIFIIPRVYNDATALMRILLIQFVN